MHDTRRYRQAAGLIWENVGDGIAVSSSTGRNIIRLNHVGAIVFLLTADALTGDEILQVLRENYGDVKGLATDVARYLSTLVDLGLVFATVDGNLIAQTNEIIFSMWLASDRALAEGRKAEADDIYRQIAERKPQTEVEYLYAGLALGRLGLAREAILRLEAGCRAYPDSQAMKENLLTIAAANGEIELMMESAGDDSHKNCEQILALPFCNPTIRAALFYHFLRSGERQAAERVLEDALDKSDAVLSIWLMADNCHIQGRIEDAERLYRLLTVRNPKTESDFLYAGLASHRLKQPTQAIDLLKRGRRLFPQSRAIVTNLMFVCVSNGKIDLLLNLRARNESKLQYLTNLVKELVENGQPELFVYQYMQYRLYLGEPDFTALARSFIKFLKASPPDQNKRELMMLFTQYLNADAKFSSLLRRVLSTGDAQSDFRLDVLNRLTCIYVPADEIDADRVLRKFRRSCQTIADRKVQLIDPIKDFTVSFSPWHALFCLAAPRRYAGAIEAYEAFSKKVWPQLDYNAPHISVRPNSRTRKIRIGFMAHPGMPMMSGLMAGLDRTKFESIYLGPGPPDNSYTARTWQERSRRAIFYSDTDMRSALETISAQKLDILLSAPSQPAVFYPVMAKLARLHMVVLEPNWTDGFASSDYYISWRPAEPQQPELFYKSKVAYLDNPPYWIDDRYDYSVKMTERKRQAFLSRLLGKTPDQRVYLCPSTPPKLHNLMDELILGILKKDPKAIFTFLRNDFPPSRNLHIRWRKKFGKKYERIRFLNTLDRSDAHLLLHAADCNLDSYPIGGMSSSFDGAILGIPTVTLPADIPFGKWLASIYGYIGVSGLVANSKDEYVSLAIKLAIDKQWQRKKSAEIKSRSRILVENSAAVEDTQAFLLAAWRRYRSGLQNANWISGAWDE